MHLTQQCDRHVTLIGVEGEMCISCDAIMTVEMSSVEVLRALGSIVRKELTVDNPWIERMDTQAQ